MNKFVPYTHDINSVTAPSSKSVAQRVLLAGALSATELEIKQVGKNDDVLNMIGVCKKLGAEINWINNNDITIIGKVKRPNIRLNVGESGLGVRLTVPIASTFNQRFTIVGKGSLRHRPLHQFKDFLPQMGVEVSLNDKYIPISINGQLQGGNYTVDGSLSSQYISGLLMALPLADKDSTLTVTSPTSTPYIDTTLNVLEFFNIHIQHQDYKTYYIKGNQTYTPQHKEFTVEGDWSGASFWIVNGLLNKGVSISNLLPTSTQADKAILDVVKLVGGDYKWENNQLIITPPQHIKPFKFDATHCPDLFPSLVVLGAGAKGTSKIKGVNRLLHKESNRAKTLQTEFKKLDLNISIVNNEMLIEGTGKLSPAVVKSRKDHRIAMSLAIASSLTSSVGVKIEQAEYVNKSYPEFWDLIK